MNMHQSFTPSEEVTISTTAPVRSSWLRSLGTWLTTTIKACADYYAAASAYEDLSRLSDAELKRRGMSRDTIARDVTDGFDRGGRA